MPKSQTTNNPKKKGKKKKGKESQVPHFLIKGLREDAVKICITQNKQTLYIGEYDRKGIAHGKGVFTMEDGNFYAGECKNGISHGQGKMTYGNGDKYEGGWENGRRHGWGKMKFADGAVYEGEWKESRCCG